MSAQRGLTAAIGRRMRAIAARFRWQAEWKGVARARGQMVQNLDLSHPEFDGVLFTGIVKEPVRNLDVGSETARSMQAYLPIGPSCC